jgi:hypothetical protein
MGFQKCIIIGRWKSNVRSKIYSSKVKFRFPVFYRGVDIGNRYCDLIVDDKVIVELKATFFLRTYTFSAGVKLPGNSHVV